MATKVQRPQEERWSSAPGEDHRTDFEQTSSAGPRAVALAAWLGAVALQVLAVLVASGKLGIELPGAVPVIVLVVCALVCAALSVAGARFWREAQRLRGSRGQGVADVVLSCLAFAPMCLFFITSKNATSRTKGAAVAAAVAIVCLLAALWVM